MSEVETYREVEELRLRQLRELLFDHENDGNTLQLSHFTSVSLHFR